MTPRLQLAGITKAYPAVVANSDVALTVQPGEIHAVLGENGAGKSTLMKIIYGAVKPDAGSMQVDGRPVVIRNPQEARALGIAMVFQHFSLFDTLTVAENIWLGLDKQLSLAEVSQRIIATSQQYGLQLEPTRPLHTLGVGERQRVEIVRSLLTGPRLLILDEPTSVLTPDEADEVLTTLKKLTDDGQITIVTITHKFREVNTYCDAVTVLRRGQLIGTKPTSELDNDMMAEMMVGRRETRTVVEREIRAPGKAVLKLEGLSVADNVGQLAVEDLALEIRAGEIVGVAGVSGNGQRELVETLAGQRDHEAGRMLVHGEVYTATRPEMVRHRIACLPEEPLRNACVADMSVAENMALRSFDQSPSSPDGIRLRRGPMRETARKLIEAYKVKTPGPDAAIRGLSGGNVQRAVLARELSSEGDLLIVANPCFGLDFAAVAEIRARIVQARNRGAAVLLVSEDLDEILQLSDRIVVMFDGRLALQTDAASADVGAIGRAMAGH
ncbi:MAG: ABC transporter ATP-binding protein [Reyranella sp.]|nr:ABC transporter ATP-binding protein [Reyranella sp.]